MLTCPQIDMTVACAGLVGIIKIYNKDEVELNGSKY